MKSQTVSCLNICVSIIKTDLGLIIEWRLSIAWINSLLIYFNSFIYVSFPFDMLLSGRLHLLCKCVFYYFLNNKYEIIKIIRARRQVAQVTKYNDKNDNVILWTRPTCVLCTHARFAWYADPILTSVPTHTVL